MFESQPVRRSDHVQWWEYLKLKSGERWHGWLAGPVVGMETHWDDGTVGCRRLLTKGALGCDYCKLGKERLWRGAVPLWGEGGDRWAVIVGETYAASLADLQHLDTVVVMKTVRRGSPLRVDRIGHKLTMPRLSEEDKQPQDIRPWLLRLWRDTTLRDWLLKHPLAAVAVKPLDGTPSKGMTPHASRALAALKRRQTDGATLKVAKGQPGTLGEVLDQVMKKNGKHDK